MPTDPPDRQPLDYAVIEYFRDVLVNWLGPGRQVMSQPPRPCPDEAPVPEAPKRKRKPRAPRPDPPKRPEDMKRVFKCLLKHAPPWGDPLSVRALIKATGYKYNSWSRDRITDLVEWGLLFREARNDGISLPPDTPADAYAHILDA